ncbi:MAG TPA: PQQ-dependent sugar dehydrogenase, partial [Rhizomicrobium sp.]|nr:PQQ-dependent sugar dehydrogenase [Rhizomicrobium sp.]
MKIPYPLLAAASLLTLAAGAALVAGPALAQRGPDPAIAALKLEPNIVPGCQVLGRRVPAELPAPGQVLETRAPTNPAARPNFKEQTRAVYVKSQTAIAEKVVASGLVRAWKIMFLPDGRMLISERPGRIRIVTQQGQVGEPIAGVPASRSAAAPAAPVLNFSDAGFLDVVLDPDFASNRKVYWSFVEIRPDGNGLAVQSAVLARDEKSFTNIATVWSAPSWKNAGHYGGKML